MVSARLQLKDLLSKPGIIQACGVGDAGQAKLVEEAGFPVAYMSGSLVSLTYGLPDVGYLTLSEMAERAASITRRIKIPLIADADDGYGDAVAITRTVQSYEQAGVAALHLEDEFPKKAGSLATIESMVAHLKAALAARRDPDLLIIARTDSMRPWRKDLGADSAEDDCVRRCVAYADAGADIVMIMSPGSEKALRRFCREIPRPILSSASSWDYDPSAAELEAIGVKVVIYPMFIPWKTTPFIRASLRDLLTAGKSGFSQDEKTQRGTLNDLLGIADYKEIQAKFKA